MRQAYQWNAYLAEALGTFLFFFIGIGAGYAVVGLVDQEAAGGILVALAHGCFGRVMGPGRNMERVTASGPVPPWELRGMAGSRCLLGTRRINHIFLCRLTQDRQLFWLCAQSRLKRLTASFPA